MGKRLMMRSTIQLWNEIYHGLILVKIVAGDPTLSKTVTPWATASTADRRFGALELGQRDGNDSGDPLELENVGSTSICSHRGGPDVNWLARYR